MVKPVEDIQLESGWKTVLNDEFSKDYFSKIKTFLIKEKQAGKTIYPPGKDIFKAFDSTPFSKVKVVIIGQDPYHGKGQAHGLCFSVQKPTPPPPSLVNIYKEIHSDLNLPIPQHGNLSKWAQQGVFLLNAILTVRANQPASHSKIGWDIFTDKVIQTISAQKDNIVFLLWGRFAQEKANLIDSKKHLILMAAHPSPFSAHNGFFGCQHFSKTNEYLISIGKEAIDWQID